MKMRTQNNSRKNAKDELKVGQKTIVLGTGPLARQIIRVISNRSIGEYELLGAVAEFGLPSVEEKKVGCRMLGTVTRLEKILDAFQPDCVIVAATDGKMEIMERLLLFLLHSNVSVRQAGDVYEELTGQVPIDTLTPDDFVFGREVRPRAFPRYVNRSISVIFAVIGIVITAPLMALIAIAVRLDSHGPAIFVQNRAGLNGRRFGLLKFRTMRLDTPERSVWVAENSDRITRVGGLLRKFRLDELPQLLNVLKGDMNLVGPRPHPSPSSELMELISRNVAECGVAMPYYTMRSMVRPGITGWAQVRYKYANGLGEEMEKLRYDLYYIKHYSVRLDLRILMMTVGVVVRGAGDGEPGEKATSESMGTSPPPALVMPLADHQEDDAGELGTGNGALAPTLFSRPHERRSGAGQ